MNINPELLSDRPTHLLNGVKVKVFTSTPYYEKCWPTINDVTIEFMEGEHKGKWSTVNINKLEVIK